MDIPEDDESDEVVVFENSPLYHHLKDVGCEDFEVSPLLSSTRPSQQTIPTSLNLLHKLKDATWYVLRFVKDKLFIGDSFTASETAFSSYLMYRCLYKTSLLLPGDKELIQSYGNNTNQCVPIKDGKVTSQIMGLSASVVLLVGCLTGIVLQYHIDRFNSALTLLSLSILLVLLSCTVMIAKSCVTVFKLKHLNQSNLNILRTFLEDSEKYSTNMKKSLRLIQEFEVIARGFLLATPQTPIGRLEQSLFHRSQRQCPVLRKLLFCSARDMILSLRQQTYLLLETFPLNTEIDNVGNYVSTIPLEELGLCFLSYQESQNVEEELKALTDNYSIGALKAVSQLFNDQMSEFIRRLALCFCSDCYSDNTQWTVRELVNKFKEMMNTPIKATKSSLDVLQKSYNFHKIGIQEKEERKWSSSAVEDNHHGNSVLVAMHSLQLHLQMALKEVGFFQEQLECSKELKEIKCKENELFLSLKHLRTELDACKECWEGGSSRLQSLLGNVSSQSKSSARAATIGEISDDVTKSQQEPIQLFGLPEPQIEFDDQTFEAYTDPNEEDCTDWDYEPITLVERERRQQQKQESLRMLSELRTVLAVRSTEREKLKLERLAQKQRDDKTSDSDRKNENEVESTTKLDVVDLNAECDGTDTQPAGDDQRVKSNISIYESKQCEDQEGTCDGKDVTDQFSVSNEGRHNIGINESNMMTDDVDKDDDVQCLPTVINRQKLVANFGDHGFDLASLAAQVAARSHNLNLQEQTFGDGDKESCDDLLLEG